MNRIMSSYRIEEEQHEIVCAYEICPARKDSILNTLRDALQGTEAKEMTLFRLIVSLVNI